MEDYRKIAIELGQTLISKAPETREDVERMLPELKESDDEKIRKELIKIVNDHYSLFKEIDRAKTIAWLEKQCEQKPAVEPKFKVGDTIRPKGSLAEYTIESISGECYHGKGWGLHISCDDDYELVEQKSFWSEEDEKFFKTALWHISYSISNGKSTDFHCDTTEWLKSLKDRVQPQSTWKPSDEQMENLSRAINGGTFRTSLLMELYQELKKLRDE